MKLIKYSYWILALAFVAWSCEDPDDTFDPINPQLSIDAVKGTVNSAQRLLDGAERQLSLAMNRANTISEIASDNYVNTATFFNQFLDKLDIDATDTDINTTQFRIHRLRELALTGLNEIGPDDPNYTANQQAEFNFMLGIAYLLSGEYFQTLPIEPGGAPVAPAEHLNAAVNAFTAGLDVATTDATKASLYLGRARALYRLGDAAKAVADADAALAIDSEFVRFVKCDAVNTPTNEIQDALWDRGTFDDLQPLPRLDFLDPKYNGSDPTTDFNIPLLKAEEAHLIKIEAALADGQIASAQTMMKDLIALVDARPTVTFDDTVDGRTQNNPGSRPNVATVTVAASPDDPQRSGLVLDRQAPTVTVPSISGTSVTADMVDALQNEDEALEMLYLMRQEIFIAEGRRFVDLGLRYVVSETESLANSNVTEADKTPNIPPFIAAISDSMDAFTYDANAGTCTITYNLNRILVANKTSDFVLPFH